MTYNPFIDDQFRVFETDEPVFKRDQAFFLVTDNHPEVFAL